MILALCKKLPLYLSERDCWIRNLMAYTQSKSKFVVCFFLTYHLTAVVFLELLEYYEVPD